MPLLSCSASILIDALPLKPLKSIGLPVLPGPVWGYRRRPGAREQSTQCLWAAGAKAPGCHDGGFMYAVIRAGGKQYRVAPGDVIRVEKLAGEDKQVQFGDVLAVSASQGELGKPQGEARVTGQVVSQVLGDKVLVFHYKRKKQYKKLNGHRQPYTAVKITGINVDGKDVTA